MKINFVIQNDENLAIGYHYVEADIIPRIGESVEFDFLYFRVLDIIHCYPWDNNKEINIYIIEKE